ncbi:MAG: hypothetical protein ABH871_04270 [Pseudomonadota bacterium]
MSYAVLTYMPLMAPALSAVATASNPCFGLLVAPINSAIAFNNAASTFVTDPFLNNDAKETKEGGAYALAHLNALLTKRTSNASTSNISDRKTQLQTKLYCPGLSALPIFAPGIFSDPHASLNDTESIDAFHRKCDDAMDAAPDRTDFEQITFEEHVFTFPPIKGEVAKPYVHSLGQTENRDQGTWTREQRPATESSAGKLENGEQRPATKSSASKPGIREPRLEKGKLVLNHQAAIKMPVGKPASQGTEIREQRSGSRGWGLAITPLWKDRAFILA